MPRRWMKPFGQPPAHQTGEQHDARARTALDDLPFEEMVRRIGSKAHVSADDLAYVLGRANQIQGERPTAGGTTEPHHRCENLIAGEDVFHAALHALCGRSGQGVEPLRELLAECWNATIDERARWVSGAVRAGFARPQPSGPSDGQDSRRFWEWVAARGAGGRGVGVPSQAHNERAIAPRPNAAAHTSARSDWGVPGSASLAQDRAGNDEDRER